MSVYVPNLTDVSYVIITWLFLSKAYTIITR